MSRKKDSPQKAALREMMNSYLKENDVKAEAGKIYFELSLLLDYS